MVEYLVTCITKPDQRGAHEDITHIGNLENKWRMTVPGAIYQIEKKISKFYTLDKASGTRSYLEIVRVLGKPPYLKAHAHAKWNDNLLAQSECDDGCLIIA
jgi:Protein of unknown function (DUF3892)